MILGMMTYTKLNQFKSSFIVKLQFENYMQFIEHKYVNDQNISLYEETHIPKNTKKEKPIKNSNSSKLPIELLINPPAKENESQVAIYQSAKSVLKQLIKNLYSQKAFFKEIQNKRGDFVEEIINLLPTAYKKLHENLKIKRAKDLADLDLKDPELNKAFYQMLKGMEIPEKNGENYSLHGYPPLTKFLDVRKNKKMRVYLLPKNLLEVVFNPSVADEIIQTREFLFNELQNENMDEKEASKKFEALFASHIHPIVDKNMLDFSISLTDPKKYR